MILSDIEFLNIAEDASCATRAWTATFALAVQHNLALYDASYLELARRLNATLATCDQRLAAAAQDAGLQTRGMTLA